MCRWMSWQAGNVEVRGFKGKGGCSLSALRVQEVLWGMAAPGERARVSWEIYSHPSTHAWRLVTKTQSKAAEAQPRLYDEEIGWVL